MLLCFVREGIEWELIDVKDWREELSAPAPFRRESNQEILIDEARRDNKLILCFHFTSSKSCNLIDGITVRWADPFRNAIFAFVLTNPPRTAAFQRADKFISIINLKSIFDSIFPLSILGRRRICERWICLRLPRITTELFRVWMDIKRLHESGEAENPN